MLVGTGELGFNGDELPPSETRLAAPMSVRQAPDVSLVLVDFSNMRVRTLTEDGLVRTLVGSGVHAYSQLGAPALESPLENPIDARYGSDGSLYIAPFHEGRVLRIDAQGRIELAACSGESLEHGGDGGDALGATMGYPGGLAIAPDGTLYVSDWTHSRVRRIGLDGRIETVVGTGERGFDAAGLGPSVRLSRPTFLDLSPDGALLIADSGNHRIARLDPVSLAVATVAGTGEAGYTGDDEPASEARLDTPMGVLASPDGGFWIADSGNDVVRAVAGDGTISTVAGDPSAELLLDPAPALQVQLRTPVGMALSPDGDLWIAERDGHRILEWRRP